MQHLIKEREILVNVSVASPPQTRDESRRRRKKRQVHHHLLLGILVLIVISYIFLLLGCSILLFVCKELYVLWFQPSTLLLVPWRGPCTLDFIMIVVLPIFLKIDTMKIYLVHSRVVMGWEISFDVFMYPSSTKFSLRGQFTT